MAEGIPSGPENVKDRWRNPYGFRRILETVKLIILNNELFFSEMRLNSLGLNVDKKINTISNKTIL